MFRCFVAISKQSVEGVAWFLLTVYSKMQEERNEELRKECFIKKEPELGHLENSSPVHIVKIEKLYCSEENTKGVAEKHLIEGPQV